MDVAIEGRFASYYDFFFSEVLKPIRLKNLEIISKHRCKNIIDLGCGTGSQCRILSQHGFEVVGVDNSKNMIQVAMRKNTHRATFILGDITKPIFLDQTFDCAIITLVLHPNDKKTITNIVEEAKRVTKKHGIIIITDYDYGRHITGKLATMVIKFIESLATSSHRKNYFEFMRRGALQTILPKDKYYVLESCSFYNNALMNLVVSKKNDLL